MSADGSQGITAEAKAAFAVRACQAFKQPSREKEFVVDVNEARLGGMKSKVIETSKLLDADGRLQRLRYKPWMVTLTYREVDQQQPEDVTRFLRALRMRFQRSGFLFRYLWVAELQGRGALHYHIIVWMPPRYYVPKFDEEGLWPHGMTERDVARSPIQYLTKYASKLHSKCGTHAFPKGYRMHGFGGLPPAAASFRRWKFLPQWARDLGGPELELRPAEGGGRYSKGTGEWWESPWEIVGIHKVCGAGTYVLVRAKARVQ
jgi:hypothetical protein